MSIARNLGDFAPRTSSGPTKPALSLPNLGETTTVSATAATGTINYDVINQSVLYYTTAATGNWTLNLRGNASTTFASFISVGQSVEIKFLVTNGATAYVPSAFNIDGTAVTVSWAGGTAPSSGTANAVDEYAYTVICTAAGTYTVFAQRASSGGGAIPTPAVSNFTVPARMNGYSAANSYMRDIAINSSGQFFAVGNTSAGELITATSSDGINWPTPTNIGLSPFTGPSIAADSAGELVAVGTGTGVSRYCKFSTFSVGTITGSGANDLLQSITVSSTGRFMAVGYNQSSNQFIATSSTDGTSWSTMNTWGSARMFDVAVNSAGLFVAVGYTFFGSSPMYSTSSNGTTWSSVSTMGGSGTYAQMEGVTVNSSGLFVAVGYDSVGAPLFATSSNGTTWTAPARMNGSSAQAYMSGVAVSSSGLFVAVGRDGFGAGVFATSQDGSTWTTPTRASYSSTGASFSRVASNSSGRFVTVGQGSTNPIFSVSS